MSPNLNALTLMGHPESRLVRKRSTAMSVRFALTGGTCETREGPVGYDAGDAIVTGTCGEEWPIERDRFLAGYEPISPTVRGQNGSYRKRPTVVQALRLDRPMRVSVGRQNDPLDAQPGDWLLRYEDGSNGVIQDSIFRETYEAAPGESRWPPPM